MGWLAIGVAIGTNALAILFPLFLLGSTGVKPLPPEFGFILLLNRLLANSISGNDPTATAIAGVRVNVGVIILYEPN